MSRDRARVAAVFVLLGVIALTVARHAPEAITQPTGEGDFDGSRAMHSLRAFVGDGAPRDTGSPGHLAARARLRGALADLGCEVGEQPFHARGWNRTSVPMMNLFVRVRGTSLDATLPCVLLSAHYDSVAQGAGAGDNAAGVACALEIIRDFKARPAQHDLLVLFADGEEIGLCGARAFVADHPLWNQVGAVVNLDARGSDGPVYIFETGLDGERHAALLASLDLPAHTTSLAREAYARMPNGTDFSVYLRGGRPGFNLAFIGSPRNYHTANDSLDHLDPRTVNQMGVSALALVRALAAGTSPMLHTAEILDWNPSNASALPRPAVWFDLFGFVTLHWTSWVSWCALAGSLITGMIALRVLRRRGSASLLGSLVSAMSLSLSLLLAVATGTVASLALKWAGMVDLPWPHAGVWWGDAMLLALGALTVALPARLIARRRQTRRSVTCSDWDAWLGGWFLIAILASAICAVAPGAVHPLLVPLVAAALLTIVATVRSAKRLDWYSVAAGGVALLIWAPLEPSFADAFGLSLGGFTAVRGALVMIALRPLCDPALAD